MYVAVKMDCFRPTHTRVKTTGEWHRVSSLDPGWLVYHVPRMGATGVLCAYDDERQARVRPRNSDRPGGR